MTREKKGRKSNPSASSSNKKSHLEKWLEGWGDPEGRARFFVIANLVAFGMLVLGVVVLILVMTDRFP